ncbi:flagellar basal-body rod protein FlgG [Orenia metallireducens]|uniref:Flagellar basal-body rod protein FlgG n=1 Tax=Orenia metallireducens TaxID=1413210 RepID=A0A285GPF0_9FIRM|nr:flagellar hook-basal body protein [Orenia metallireducens]PRX35750.1 flagellar basal-body rod protein FlgG [Orenia metallireducens]SNY24211.1 flagellar basal-body rod protein FlgG [Orenia metallireducens]
MIRGLYTATAGMENALIKNNTISNNLANINTTGYKKQTTIEKSFSNKLLNKIYNNVTTIGKVGTGVGVDRISNDFDEGAFTETENTFDWAIKGDGFFAVQTPQGIRYTRNGNFTVNNQGQVVTQNGHLVMGEGGILQIPSGTKVNIDANNLVVDGRVLGRIQIVSFANKSGLIKEGDTLFRRGPEVGGTFRATGEVVQGYLEDSNVNAIQEMVRMIDNSRLYEADQKVIQAHNDTLGKAVNDVGKV